MKKILTLSLIMVGLVVLVGCGAKKETSSQNENGAKKETTKETSVATSSVSGPCQKEKVDLPNYGDKGQRLENCFIQYPGEPSRQDKSYYIVEDTCGQFTQAFMENMLGEKIAKMELPKVESIYNCTYYFNDKEYVMLNLEYLSVENQKIGNEAMDRKVEKEVQIPMENMIAYQEDGAINVIYLVLGPQKFISLRPSSKIAISNDKFIKFAAKIGAVIKDYK